MAAVTAVTVALSTAAVAAPEPVSFEETAPGHTDTLLPEVVPAPVEHTSDEEDPADAEEPFIAPAPQLLLPVAEELSSSEFPTLSPVPSLEECRRMASELSLGPSEVPDRALVAQMVHSVFSCVGSLGGLDDEPPTTSRGWDGAEIWGFSALGEQVAAEAVVVSYCESLAYRPSAIFKANRWGYGGVFQMGRTEMRRFGLPGADRFDPVDNTIAAANYFVWMWSRGLGWGGWGPWAVVNTNFDDDVNNQVKVPVLPRFTSTEPGYRGVRGAELPAWAVDPWAWEVPQWGGCPIRGGSWPDPKPSPAATAEHLSSLGGD